MTHQKSGGWVDEECLNVLSSDSEIDSSSSSKDSEDEDYEDDDSGSVVLSCTISTNPLLKSGMKVEALPDTGCDISTISEDLARNIGVRILQTRIKLYGATGTKVAVVGRAVIFVKVDGVSVKRLRVLVEKAPNEAFTISYRDLITLKVIASNFPNQVTSPNAPLLPHPYNNPRTTPLLHCTVTVKKTEVDVYAVPDSGCCGGTIISCDFVKRAGIPISPTTSMRRAASNTDIVVAGKASISLKIKGQSKVICRNVLVTNITDDILLGWNDLISLGVLKSNFPTPTPE